MELSRLNTKLLQRLGWEEQFQNKSCKHVHSARAHSHQFTNFKIINKICKNCNVALRPDSQAYDYDFTSDEAMLFNTYECNVCQSKGKWTLYDGELF